MKVKLMYNKEDSKVVKRWSYIYHYWQYGDIYCGLRATIVVVPEHDAIDRPIPDSEESTVFTIIDRREEFLAGDTFCLFVEGKKYKGTLHHRRPILTYFHPYNTGKVVLRGVKLEFPPQFIEVEIKSEGEIVGG